jgi:hypothetical protein
VTKKTSTLAKLPVWCAKAAQGITYWTGHRRCLYDDYPLGESAFVAEICNLIFAHLGKDEVLLCEVRYSELAAGGELPECIRPRARADIVVAEAPLQKGAEPLPKFVVEVKRGSAPKREIDADLRRLVSIRRMIPDYRAFLIVVAEAKRLDRFVTSEGQSVRDTHAIPDDEGHFRVRRTFKAAHAFKSRDTAQYASILEVYPNAAAKASRLS